MDLIEFVITYYHIVYQIPLLLGDLIIDEAIELWLDFK